MAYGKDKINEVRKLYVFDRFSLDKASDFANVSYATAQRWKNQAKANGDDWDKIRATQTMRSHAIEELGMRILNHLEIVFESASKRLEESRDMDAEAQVRLLASISDSYVKSTSAIQKSMPSVSKLAVAFEVLDKLKDYVMKNHPELALKFVEMIVPFGETLDKELK